MRLLQQCSPPPQARWLALSHVAKHALAAYAWKRPGCGRQVEIKVTAIRCISRAEPLPFELADASRSEADIADKGEAVVVLQVRANPILAAAPHVCMFA